MGKQGKKNKRNKNELDLILAQLKKSYSDESKDEPEEDDVDSFESNDNAEFNEILEKLFASTGSTPTANRETVTLPIEDEHLDEDSADEVSIADDTVAEQAINEECSDGDIVEEEKVNEILLDKSVAEETVDRAPIDFPDESEDTVERQTIDTKEDEERSDFASPSLFDKSIDENQSETDVDSVLQLMFANTVPKSEEINEPDPDEDNDEDNDEPDAVDISDGVDTTESPSYFDDEVENENYEYISDDESVLDNENEADRATADFAVEDEIYGTDEDQVGEITNIILDPSLYTFDPLQERLPEFSFTDSKINDSVKEASHDTANVQSDKIVDHAPIESKKDEFDTNDISLLLKFGYGDEVKSQVGEEEAQRVLAEKDNSFHPESHKIPYGFCGKEFSDRSQSKQIKEKFKSDKNILIIQIILVALIAFAALAVEIFFEFASDRSSYLVVNAVEMILIAISVAILNKKIISGVLGIVRFEANLYSVLAYIIFSYALCNIATALIYAVKAPIWDTSGLMVFGFCIILYVLFTLVSELINCLREASNFDLISRSENFYTAERHMAKSSDSTAASIAAEANENSYRLTRTSLISGYFRKSSMSISGNVNLIYIIGIVPIISLIMGCISALISENILNGIFSMMITTLLCIPFAYFIIPAISEYMVTIFFKKKKIALIGHDAADTLAKADSLFFDDTDAVEIISYTEIHPTKNASERYTLEIAHRVFEALNGPLGEFSRKQSGNGTSEQKQKSDVVINSISENGIEIYFESSINILIGDKNYMQSRNIKVKTDSNLNTAIKGFDRSVIYMAFDGIPKLGFIITSKIKPEFADIVSKLDSNDVKVYVDTYEPQLNDLYFEQNRSQNAPAVSVCKSEEYESTDYKPICDGNIVCLSDSFSLAQAILECRKVVNQRKKNQRTHFALVISGIIISCLLTALLNINQVIFILSGLKSHASLILNIVMLLSLIPGAVSILKSRKATCEGQNNKKEPK